MYLCTVNNILSYNCNGMKNNGTPTNWNYYDQGTVL